MVGLFGDVACFLGTSLGFFLAELAFFGCLAAVFGDAAGFFATGADFFAAADAFFLSLLAFFIFAPRFLSGIRLTPPLPLNEDEEALRAIRVESEGARLLRLRCRRRDLTRT